MKHVLVTGGAGFIGSNIVAELVQQRFRVTVLDNLSTGHSANLQPFRSKVSFIRGDIRNLTVLRKSFRGIDYILHQAALPSVPRSINNPLNSHNHNINGTFNVLLAAHERRVSKVVLASSSSIYGNRKSVGPREISHKSEIMKPMPLSPYAVNKLVGEEYAKVFSHIFELPTVCLRYFNVFGPNQDPKSEYAAVIPRFISIMLRHERPKIFGDGLQSRDFTYVDNVVQANLLAMMSTRANLGQTINIACGERTSLRQLVTAINRQLGTHLRPDYSETRAGDVKHSLADIRKAKRLINYSPVVSFADGLHRTVEWYRGHQSR